MSLTSPSFLSFAIVVILAFQFNGSGTYRTVLLATADLFFIVSYVDRPAQLIPLLAFLALGYGCLQAAQRSSRSGLMACLVGLTLLVYIFLKQFSFLPHATRIPFPYLTIGLSYILFRLLHLMIDGQNGNLPDRVGPFAFFRYTCNMLTFVSGPIQTYQDFRCPAGPEHILSEQRVYAAFSRIVTGYVKFGVVAAAADYVFDNANIQLYSSPSLHHLLAVYMLCAVSYTIYLYYNFAGYMDIVIGLGWLLGQDLPENFAQPFKARSFLEFWQRWHMTLSEWFKTYLFNPLLMAMMGRVSSAAMAPALGVIAFFVTFLVMGMWHGTTFVFLIYGLLMGAGASINKLWQIFAAWRLGKKRYQAVTKIAAYGAVCRGMTFAYFAMALTCLWMTQLPAFATLAAHLGIVGILLAFIILTIGSAVLMSSIDAAVFRIAALWHRLAPPQASTGGWVRLMSLNFGLASRICLVLIVISILNKPPEFVYKAF